MVIKCFFYLLSLMLFPSALSAFSIACTVENDQVIISLEDMNSLELSAQQAVYSGHRLRLVLKAEGHYEKEMLINRILSFSPVTKNYIIIENQHITAEARSFKEAYRIFTQWPLSKDFFLLTQRLTVTYTNHYYSFPFSLLYLLPGGAIIDRKSFIVNHLNS